MANAKVYSDLSFVPSLNNEGDIAQVYDYDAINQSLFNILNTKKGSRVMDPEFGCDVYAYLFELFDEETINKISNDIYRNFVFYEPRIKITSIEKKMDIDNLQYHLTINYNVISKNEKGKFEVVLQKL